MNKEIIIEVIRKLVGNISPVRSSRPDERYSSNLEELLRVLDGLVFDLLDVKMENKGVSEWSREHVALRIDGYFQRLVNELNEYGYCFKDGEE